MQNIPIQSIMTTQILSVSKDASLDEAALLMNKHSIRHLLVTEGGKLQGILSKSDIERFDFIKGWDVDKNKISILSSVKVENVMTLGVHTLYEDETLKDAAEMLTLGAYHALPIVNFDGDVLGIVSSTDLILYMLKHIKESS